MNDTESITSSEKEHINEFYNKNNIMFYKKKAIKYMRNGKKIVINIDYKVFGTGLTGRIRNAVTGQPYLINVGSKEENKFFKVISMIGNKAITLFYSSPAEYELHQQQSLSDEVKENWRKKSLL